MRRAIFLLALLLIAACSQAKDFRYGLGEVSRLNSKYNTSMETYPESVSKISMMLDDFESLKQMQLERGMEPFNLVVGYRMLNLEAENLYIQSQKYGNSGTTKFGFGCKSRPLIIESAGLRNMSANKAFEAVGLMKRLAAEYPEEAKQAGFSEKNAIFLNATFHQIALDARRDSGIINNFCPANTTLVLYKEELRKRSDLSEDFINNLSYGQAVPIWKRLRGID